MIPILDWIFEGIVNWVASVVSQLFDAVSGLFLEALGTDMTAMEEWEAFEQAIQDGFDFTQLHDFGETMNNNIYIWYADAEEANLWRPLLNHIEFVKETSTMTTNTTNPFAGKTVVATGKLMNYTRDGIQNKLLSLGANPASSITKKTDYLIVGEKAGSKLTKAQQLGIETLTEEEFEQMLAD